MDTDRVRGPNDGGGGESDWGEEDGDGLFTLVRSTSSVRGRSVLFARSRSTLSVRGR